jgi:hypothetical protein
MRLFCTDVILLACLLFAGCTAHYTGMITINDHRIVSVSANHLQGIAPLDVTARVIIGLNETDTSMRTAVTKIEVDFADGSGWQDVTAQISATWDNPSATMNDQLITHHYIAAGQYIIRARVTYSDNQILESPATYSEADVWAPVVKVLPPPA